MRNLVFAASAAFLVGSLSLASAAMADPTHGPNGTAMSGAQSMGAATPPAARSNDHNADDANANSNGRYATDRDKGLDRSQDRASAEGLKHRHAMRRNDHDADAGKADADDRAAGKDADDRK